MSRRMENQQRVRKQKKNKSLLLVAVIVVLCIGYLLTCFMSKEGQIVRNTSINGTDVSGMTKEQARQQAEKDFEANYKDKVLTVSANGAEYQIKIYDCLAMDGEGAAQKAVDYAHGSFLTRGWQLLRAELFGYKIIWNPHISEENLLEEAMGASGLMDVNTTVQTTYETTKDSLIFHKGKTGVSVDREGLREQIHEAVSKADYDTVIESPLITGTVEDVDIQEVYKAVHTKKAEATLDPKNDYKIVKSVRGVSFDKDSAAAALAAGAEGEDVIVPLKIKKPKITTKKLKKHLFKDTLGSCTTNVGGSSARISNVALAAKTINGTILLPGESFSYNGTVGERTTARGYRSAPAYSNGQSVQELGGGICQVSSTLYKATLLSNLEIVEHHNHSYVSAYIGIGMDATVSWGGPDYRFKNNTDYPIKISASYSDGQVTCKILGAKLDKKKVEMTADVLKVNERGTVYQDDPTMEKGTSVVVSSGHDGYVVQTYRNIYNGKGKKISSEKEAYCVYRKQDKVVRVGTKEPEVVEDTADTSEETTSEVSEE
ncbi:MAG: VanW family protein [Eubacteriales bacterium]|nr:VanW family protein [Eubacteriales bacterium]